MAMSSTQSSPRGGPVAVFYDMEACPVPNTQEVSRNIFNALRAHQFNGPINKSAYGDFTSCSQRIHEGLCDTNFQCLGVPKGTNSLHMILTDMFFFALQNPPPACIMLISSNDHFSDALHRLAMRGYTVILAIPSSVGVSSSLRDVGTFVWDWPSLSETSRSLSYPNMSTQSSTQQKRNTCDGSVAVLWDMDSCPIPSNILPEEAAYNIEKALRVNQISGAIKTFSAYGDFKRFSQPIIKGLQRANVQCMDVPKGTNPFDSILVDMFFFALDNRPPAYIMLISGDSKFCNALNRLGMFRYTVILAIPPVVGASSRLRDAGDFVWDWPILSETSRSSSLSNKFE